MCDHRLLMVHIGCLVRIHLSFLRSPFSDAHPLPFIWISTLREQNWSMHFFFFSSSFLKKRTMSRVRAPVWLCFGSGFWALTLLQEKLWARANLKKAEWGHVTIQISVFSIVTQCLTTCALVQPSICSICVWTAHLYLHSYLFFDLSAPDCRNHGAR